MGAVPALTLFFGSMTLPDTPNSLVQRGRPEDGRRILQKIRGDDNVDVEVGGTWAAARVASSSMSKVVQLHVQLQLMQVSQSRFRH